MRKISMARHFLDELTIKDNRVNWKSITTHRRNGEVVLGEIRDLVHIYDRLPRMGVFQGEYRDQFCNYCEPYAVFHFVDGSFVRIFFHKGACNETFYPSFAY